MIKKENLKSAKNIYRTWLIKDFPRAERIPFKKYKRAVKNKLMNVYGYYVDNKIYGYVVTIEEDKVAFISYLAIMQEKRDKGHGSKMLKEFAGYFKKNKYIIIEADSPEGITDEKELNTIKRRKDFYYRNGFEEVKGVDYCIYGVKYDLLVYKINCGEVTNEDAIEITKKCYLKIGSNMKIFNLKTI